MSVPTDSDDPRRAELLIYVNEIRPEILERLSRAAMFPFAEGTYIGHGDTIDWMIPVVDKSDLTTDLIIYSIIEEHRNLPLMIENDEVQLYWLVPITDSELEFKKSHGIDALLELFDKVKHPAPLYTSRASYV